MLFHRTQCLKVITGIPDEDSSLSSLLTSQSRFLENWVQLFLFPRINVAAGHKEKVHDTNFIAMNTFFVQSALMGPGQRIAKCHFSERKKQYHTSIVDTLNTCPKPRNGKDSIMTYIYIYILIWKMPRQREGMTQREKRHKHVWTNTPTSVLAKNNRVNNADRQERKEGGTPNPLSAVLEQVYEGGNGG